jgi:hypothetical protein
LVNGSNSDYGNENSNRSVMSQPAMTDSAVIFRLNPNQVVSEIESYLRGGFTQTYFDKDIGDYKTKFVKTGEPVLNDYGVQAVLSVIKAVVNSSTVQAAYTEERYTNYLTKLHKDLTRKLWSQPPKKFGISNLSIRHDIISNIMFIVEPFMSRTIDNKEREGLTAMLKETVHTVRDKGKSFMGFGGR